MANRRSRNACGLLCGAAVLFWANWGALAGVTFLRDSEQLFLTGGSSGEECAGRTSCTQCAPPAGCYLVQQGTRVFCQCDTPGAQGCERTALRRYCTEASSTQECPKTYSDSSCGGPQYGTEPSPTPDPNDPSQLMCPTEGSCRDIPNPSEEEMHACQHECDS